METGAAVKEFITIVPVGETKTAVEDPAFVTVLTVGAAKGGAEVVVNRPRGARLGLGLKFEGGSAVTEKVKRLLVQSCAEDSPAASACAPWGKLIPGDEILAIDGTPVSDLTRIECVRRLKDSDETLVLLVRHFEREDNIDQQNMETKEITESKGFVDVTRPMTLPPPVPPRKLGKKNSFKEKTTLQTVGEQNALINLNLLRDPENGKESIINALVNQHSMVATINKLSRKSSFDSHIHRQTKESLANLRKGSPEEVRRLVRRLSDGKAIPPEAEVYIDLLSNEWERCLVLADAESDDTGSSISTVVDRLGSMASSVENSIPSTPVMQPKSIDIQKVLNSIENIETNILKDMTNVKYNETKIETNDDKRHIKNLTLNGPKITCTTSNNALIIENIKPNPSENDKNNNGVIKTPLLNDKTKLSGGEVMEDIALETPKPMPRNTKIERSSSEKKPRPIPVPEVQTSSMCEQLLTPTKKTCIESWLQRSEAEMHNKLEEKLEENTVPEALPRLIDFVPKNQFKENSTDPSTCIRPTTAPPPPPPPPPETREDGSGASLDTIGELDESCDVVDNAKATRDNDTNKRKSIYERNFWDDRVNRSDAEDKSLSNDDTPLPSCPRQPPDGVETPSDIIEKIPDLPTRLPPSNWTNTRPRYSYMSRTQDARSEASVKDKIAMFSVDLAVSSDRLDKCGTLPIRSHSTIRKNVIPLKNNYTETTSLDRRLTKSQDNLDEMPRSYKRNSDRPEVLGALENTNIEKKNYRLNQTELFNKPLFYGSTTTLPTNAAFTKPSYHIRSVSEDNSNKNLTSHKSNLEYLIEQRKKSMSKLRGLVIPEVQAPIVDLPEIKVKEPLSKSLVNNFSQIQITRESKVGIKNPSFLSEKKWNTNFLQNNIPKYSPAFKRKSLQIYTPSLSKETTPERKMAVKMDTNHKSNNYISSIVSKPVRGTQEFSKPVISKSTQLLNKDIYKINHNEKNRDYKNYEIRICTTTDVVDSDNESALSSTQSSYRSSASSPMHNIDHLESDSSRLSPKVLHYNSYSNLKTDTFNKLPIPQKNGEEYNKRKICRSMSSDTNVSLSSSAGSAATSGSQASCSSLESSVADSEKRKVSTIYNVDTINRRNIVASSKCRSGRDVTLTSPVIETKFSHESYNRSPSPTQKPSELLSTLTSAVSAIANKGENRRRSKIIVDTDSDSDNDDNIRQRKSDYKNARLKRNSSTSNKNNKQNDNVQITETIEKTPQVFKDKLLKENYVNNGQDNQKNKNNKINEIGNVMGLTKLDKEKEKRNGFAIKKEVPIKNVKQVQNVKPVPAKGTNLKSNINKIQEQPVRVTTQVIRLIKGAGTGVGLILAGGIDCEAKDVTVHRVLEDSIAAKAGIKRGSKILCINDNTMNGLTHAQSVKILKEQRSEVIIEIELQDNRSLSDCGSQYSESNGQQETDASKFSSNKLGRSVVTITLEKAGGGAGLGFGLDGGRDSPYGDRPLTIKKLFAGGAAAQSGQVLVGAELLSAGGQAMDGFTRTQAWAALKALPAGQVALVLRNP